MLEWDGMRMGWAGLPRYLGCTAFSDWEHRVEVVVVAEARGLDWTGLDCWTYYLMFEGTG